MTQQTKTWGGARKGSGRKPAPPHLSRQNLIINVRDLNQTQRETLVRLVNEWLAQQKRIDGGRRTISQP